MEVQIDGLAKRFATQWVFRDLSYKIATGVRIAVSGPNGSGKSTLLKIIAGALTQSKGSIAYRISDHSIPPDKIFSYVSFAAPYAELIEELTLPEAWEFHGKFKVWLPGVDSYLAFMEEVRYRFDDQTPMHAMSSGMKQRIRLAFALYTRSDLLILDEPTSNLDQAGIDWFHDAITRFTKNRTVVIASNIPDDLRGCADEIRLGVSKPIGI